MTKTLELRVESMKQLAMELEEGKVSWEDYCGYTINEELAPLINLPEGQYYV